VVAGQSPPSGDPGKTAFDHPSFGKGVKPRPQRPVPMRCGAFGDDLLSLGSAGTPDDLDGPAQVPQQPEDQLASIVGIPPEQLDLGKLPLQWLQQALGSLLIGVLGTADLDGQQMALGINQQVPFASPDFFSPYRSPFRAHEQHWF
jgi:hypothetical protein